MVQISDTSLRRAASQGMDAFLQAFADAYREELGGPLAADNMDRLSAAQHTLLAYVILRDELMEGGFCQLIQNGYGPYILHNPLARALKGWGVPVVPKLLYAARTIYDEHRQDLERERTDDEFMAMYEQYEQFDPLEEDFLDAEEEATEAVARYVDQHLAEFAEVTGLK